MVLYLQKGSKGLWKSNLLHFVLYTQFKSSGPSVEITWPSLRLQNGVHSFYLSPVYKHYNHINSLNPLNCSFYLFLQPFLLTDSSSHVRRTASQIPHYGFPNFCFLRFKSKKILMMTLHVWRSPLSSISGVWTIVILSFRVDSTVFCWFITIVIPSFDGQYNLHNHNHKNDNHSNHDQCNRPTC